MSIASKIEELQAGTIFLVIGGGELLMAMTAKARKTIASRVVFTGFQRLAAQYCAAMDVLLMTSKYEGLPLVILEALACGTPVVSTDVGGIRECLQTETGVVLPEDASDVAYASAGDPGSAGNRIVRMSGWLHDTCCYPGSVRNACRSNFCTSCPN